MIDLVTFLESSQNGDRVLYGGLFDQHGLKSSFQSGVLFDIFAVFVQCGRTNAVKLTSCQHGLQQIARIHRAVRFARTDDGVQFVNEKNNLAFTCLDFSEYGFEAFFKFSAEFRTRNERTHVE